MNVLIVYGTSEGQTQKIATLAATHIREHGHPFISVSLSAALEDEKAEA